MGGMTGYFSDFGWILGRKEKISKAILDNKGQEQEIYIDTVLPPSVQNYQGYAALTQHPMTAQFSTKKPASSLATRTSHAAWGSPSGHQA